MLLIVFIVVNLFIGCSDSGSAEKVFSETNATETKSTAIDGAWETVFFLRNSEPATNNQFKIFGNGFFCMISWDSTNKFSYGGYGKYELEGNIYKETFLNHSNPNNTGAMDWQEYEMKGDTLIMRGFNKVIVGGKDVTADFPKIEEKRVRVK